MGFDAFFVALTAHACATMPSMADNNYAEFLSDKGRQSRGKGFDPPDLPPFLFDFQRDIVAWCLASGRAGIFADCGLGKTPMQLAWAQAVIERTNNSVLILTPLAVSQQLEQEANKFGVVCSRLRGERPTGDARVIVTNYEQLQYQDPADYAGVVCDESSILKNFAGKHRKAVSVFMRAIPFRLLCTATAAPNDYTELGTSSEALGYLGHMDMLGRFFRNEQGSLTPNRLWNDGGKWRFKGHAERPFWRWVCSWARAIRKPSDFGYDDARFELPPLNEYEHVVKARTRRPGLLFDLPAENLAEERAERRRTIDERCERVAELVDHGDQALVWCHLNDESSKLAGMIDGAEEVRGSQSDDEKESRLGAFARGDLRVLVTKPKIGAWGLNLQRCAHTTFFPSHSYEQYYQGVRRCWRFGQKRPVRVDVVATDGEAGILRNLKRKADAADRMFDALVDHMNDARRVVDSTTFTKKEKGPRWL